MKQGPDRAKTISAFTEDQVDEVNDNATILRALEDLRSANPNIHTYFTALRISISYIKTVVKATVKWTIIIYLNEGGTHSISTKFFEDRTFNQLQGLIIKIKRNSKMDDADPEISKNPRAIRFMRNDIFRIFHLNQKSISLYPKNELMVVEDYLRRMRFFSTEKG